MNYPHLLWYEDLVSVNAAEREDWELDEQPRLETVQVGDWPGLGGDVQFSLGRRHTILVGRNSAGKSLLIEGLSRAARAAVGFQNHRSPFPLSFHCTTKIAGSSIRYEYLARPNETDEDTEGPPEGPPSISWTERCWPLPSGPNIWRVAESKLFLGEKEVVPFAPGVGLLTIADSPQDPPTQVEPLRQLLRGMRTVPAGVPRSESIRREVLVPSIRIGGVRRWRALGIGRVNQLAFATVNMWERDRGRYEEFRQLLIDLKLVNDVAVKVYQDPAKDVETGRTDFAAILFNGVNLGLHSDGTLRIAEIFAKLLQPGLRCLLIEEPETAVHPGMLEKILAVLDSYSLDRQIIVSTHSPQVVDWGGADELRLVLRKDESTYVEPLSDKDRQHICRHLEDDGPLSEFIYNRQRTD